MSKYDGLNLNAEEKAKLEKLFPGGPWKTPAKLKAKLAEKKKAGK